MFEYAIKIKCWFVVTLSLGTLEASPFPSLLFCGRVPQLRSN